MFERDALEEVRFTLAAPRESVEHLGLDRPRRHGIDAHAGLGTLKRRSLGQTFDSVLARGIDGSIRRADLAQCHLITVIESEHGSGIVPHNPLSFDMPWAKLVGQIAQAYGN